MPVGALGEVSIKMVLTYTVVYTSEIAFRVGCHDVDPFELLKCGLVSANNHLFVRVAALTERLIRPPSISANPGVSLNLVLGGGENVFPIRIWNVPHDREACVPVTTSHRPSPSNRNR